MQNLKYNLAKQAMIICGERDRIRGDNIKIAPLQISTRPRNMEQLDQSGHFHYRKDVVRIYSEELSDVVPYEQIFEVAERKAVKGAMGCRTEKAKTEHILRYANVVLISGQAGIGKSTLSKLLVEKMLDSNDPLYQAEFVFFVRFRDLDYEQNYDLLEFLTNSASFLSSISSEDRTKIIQHLEASANIFIMMDGLDEADVDLKMNYPNISADSHTIAAVFIHNLLSGRLLGKSKKLVTSRPRKLAHLPRDYSSNLYLNLLGLNDERRLQISHMFETVARFLFGLCNKQTLDELLDYVEDEELNTEADRNECEEILKKFVIEKLQRHRDAASDSSYDPYYETIVPVMGWLREMGDDTFTKQAAGCLRDGIEINGEILPGDIPSVNHILRRRDTSLVLTVYYPNFVGGCSNHFFRELDETLAKNPNVQVSEPLKT